MGAVYLAEDTELGRRVALKVPRFDKHVSAEVIARFKREARLAAQIEHEGLCRVYDVGEHNGQPFLAMQYLDGTPLSHSVGKPWPPAQALALVHRLATAVQVLHEKGIIHRDLKPANVMMVNGKPVLLDFGLARSFVASSQWLTGSGHSLGTPLYMAPEQIEGNPAALGPPCDVYALGAMLYQLLTGEVPFPSATLAELYGKILVVPPRPPSKVRPSLGTAFDALMAQVLAKKPTDRPPTAKALAQAIQALMRASSGREPSPAPTENVPVLELADDTLPSATPADALRVTCGKCGTRLRVPVGAGGRTLKCPKCQSPVSVLADTQLTRTEPAPATPGAQLGGAGVAYTETWLRRLYRIPMWVLIIGVVVCTVGIVDIITYKPPVGSWGIGIPAGFTWLLLGVPCAALGMAGLLALLYRAWALIQDGQARTGPGKAVLFLLIPLFNLYWMFQAYVGLANDMNAYARRHNIAAPPVSARLALISCIMVLIPYVNLLATIPYLLLMNRVKNAAIVINERQLGAAG